MTICSGADLYFVTSIFVPTVCYLQDFHFTLEHSYYKISFCTRVFLFTRLSFCFSVFLCTRLSLCTSTFLFTRFSLALVYSYLHSFHFTLVYSYVHDFRFELVYTCTDLQDLHFAQSIFSLIMNARCKYN